MRQLFIILGFIAAVLALILAVTPLSQIAYIPGFLALIFGLVAYYISKRNGSPKKTVQLIFLLTVISLGLSTYKFIFNAPEVGDLEELQIKEEASIEDSKEILEELDLEDMDLKIDDSDVDEIKTKDLIHLEDLEDQ